MFTVYGSGTHTTGGTSEEDLAVIAVPGRYRLALDVVTVVGGTTPDIYEVRIKANVLPAGTERLILMGEKPGLLSFTGGQIPEPHIQTPEFEVLETATITIKRAQGSTDRAVPWSLQREGGQVAQVVADAGNSTSAFQTTLTEADDTHIGKFLLFLTGNNAGQVKKVSDFATASNLITISGAFTDIPAGDDYFELLNR